MSLRERGEIGGWKDWGGGGEGERLEDGKIGGKRRDWRMERLGGGGGGEDESGKVEGWEIGKVEQIAIER